MSESVSFGYETVEAEEKTRRVGAVFSNVAAKYDVMNDAMSGGMHRLWKDQFVRRVKPQPGEAILDMAGGTGDIAFRLAERGAQVTVADINQDMLDVGLERAVERGIDTLVWSCQNAETLSYPDRSFDAYTIAFGIRNVTHIDRALAEAFRVLKFGGRFFCLEFSTTTWPGFKEAYDLYSHRLVPRIGKAIAERLAERANQMNQINRGIGRHIERGVIDAKVVSHRFGVVGFVIAGIGHAHGKRAQLRKALPGEMGDQ